MQRGCEDQGSRPVLNARSICVEQLELWLIVGLTRPGIPILIVNPPSGCSLVCALLQVSLCVVKAADDVPFDEAPLSCSLQGETLTRLVRDKRRAPCQAVHAGTVILHHVLWCDSGRLPQHLEQLVKQGNGWAT